MKQIATFFTLWVCLILSPLAALNRDFQYDIEEMTIYKDFDSTECPVFCSYEQEHHSIEGFTSDLMDLIPRTELECWWCGDPSIYLGYLNSDLKKYRLHLRRQLEYCSKYPHCSCLWPERAQVAAQISDTAYLLFRDLISTTALSSLIKKERDQRELIENSKHLLNMHGVTVSFIAQQFRFSDYYHVCQDIENFATGKYEEKEVAIIKDKLSDILEVLYAKYFALYGSCYKKHPNAEIDQEIRFLKFLVKDISGLERTLPSSASLSSDLNASIFLTTQPSNGFASFSPQSNIFLEQGTLFNDLLLYKEAIEALTLAIQFNPSNRDAYIERAVAYFETDQLSLALKDYDSAKKLTIVPPYKSGSQKTTTMAIVFIPENKTEFANGLVSGTVDGAKISSVEFVPSIFSCCRGILNGLWAFTCSPKEVSQEMVNSAFAIGEYVSSHSTAEYFQYVVSELKELSRSWNKLNDYSRGQKIGFIIGKYGIDIFAPAGAFKAVNKVRALKRANTMCTLQSCAVSQSKQAKILEESAKRALMREKIISDSTKSGKILVRNSNTQAHIVQPKHGWHKLVQISGNVEEDCKKVITILEENQIFLEKYRLNPTESFEKIVRYNHQMKINGHEVKAVFNKNLETGEMFLNDAWVITK